MSELALNRVCNLEDFADPALHRTLRAVFAHELHARPRFPEGRELRKYWEVGMSALALERGGAMRRDAEVLGVGAGTEPTLFWLTNHVRRVFATDLYIAPGVWAGDAPTAMLTDPGRHYGGRWDPQRLVVQHMDGRRLLYPDASFDAVFSSGSIEHFGDWTDIEQAMSEAFRVLRPGGVLSMSTEFRVEGPHGGLPGMVTFDPDDISRHLVGAHAWDRLGGQDLTLSPATRATEQDQATAAGQGIEDRRRFGGFARLEHVTLPAPHVVLRFGPHVFTSVHIALRKRDAP